MAHTPKVQTTDKQIRVTYRHKRVATVDLEFIKRHDGTGSDPEEWSETYKVVNVLIDARLKRWMIDFLADFLPKEGEFPTYLSYQGGYSLDDRLHNMLHQALHKRGEEIAVADLDAAIHVDMVDLSLKGLAESEISIGFATGKVEWHDGQRREPEED